MPTLFRLLTILTVIAALGYAVVYLLATRVEPEQRDLSITVEEKSPDKK